MARKKRSLLPPVTQKDHDLYPERIRSTPNGGWAWRCHYCHHYASSKTLSDKYVCRRHGGVTPKQRDLLLALKWQYRTGKRPRPPGRPLIHGWRSRRPKVKLSDMVALYEERQAEAREHTLRLLRRWQREDAKWQRRWGKADKQ
jgi:hypothetical protein